MITFYLRTIKEPRLRPVEQFQKGCWIYAENPSISELDTIAVLDQYDRGLLTDAVDPFEVPRVEIEDGTTYAFTRMPWGEGNDISTSPVMVAIGQNSILTISKKPLPFIQKFLKGQVNTHTTQKIKLFLQIFYEVISTYNKFLTNTNRQVRTLSANITQVTNDHIARFVAFEGTVNDFLAALVPTQTLLKNILSGKHFQLFEEDEDLAEDVMLAAGQLIEVGKATLTTIVNIRNAYSTLMTNNLNRIIKLLTAFTIVLTIPTMVASFYGMNVPLPFSLGESPYAFWIIGLSTGLISLVVLGIFYRNRWL